MLIATVIGVVLGHFWPEAGIAMKPLGDGFIKLVRMIIAPVIFCTVVVGIAGAAGMKAVGKAGGLALVYFEVVTTLALVIGLIVVNVVAPGAGMNVDPATIDATSVAQYVSAGRTQSTTEIRARHHSHQRGGRLREGRGPAGAVVFLLFGFALRSLGCCGTPLFELLEKLSSACCSGSSGSS